MSPSILLTREHLGPWNFRSRWKFADAFERLRSMLELESRCGYSQAPVLQSVKVDPSSPPSPAKKPSHGEGGVEGSTLTLCSTGACEYPHLIFSSSIFLNLPNASANFQRDLKFYGPRCSLVSPSQNTLCLIELKFDNTSFVSANPSAIRPHSIRSR